MFTTLQATTSGPMFHIIFCLNKPWTVAYLPSTLLSSIMHPSSPNVTITNLIFGNLTRIETRALGTDAASVHACKTGYALCPT